MSLPHASLTRRLPAALPTQSTAKLSSMAQGLHAIQSRIVHVRAEGQRMRDLMMQAPVTAASRLDWIHQQLQKTP